MAKKSPVSASAPDPAKRHRRTSIGDSANTRKRNKSKTFKRSRGQG